MRFFFLFLILMPFMFADEVLEDTVYLFEGGAISDLSGTEFKLGITSINEGEKIVLKGKETLENGSIRDKFIWMERDSCEVYKLTRFCFTDSDNSSGKWEATLEKYNLSESLGLTVDIDDGEIYRGGHITFTVTLENDGYSEARNISLFLQDMVPFEVISSPSFRANGTSLTKYFDSFGGDMSESFAFTLATSLLGSIPLSIGIRFQDLLGAWKEYSMGPFEFNVSDFFNYSFILDPSNLGVDTVANLSIYLQNNITSDYVYVSSLEVRYPPLLELEDSYRISDYKEGVLTYKSNFSYNVTRLPTATFRAVTPGRGNISLRMEYLLGSSPTTSAVHTEQFSFIVLPKKLQLMDYVDTTRIYSSEEQVPVSIELNNPYMYENILVKDVTIGVAESSHIFYLDEIVHPHSKRTVFNASVSLPSVQQDTNLSMNLTVVFGTKHSQESLTLNYSLQITREALEIQHILSSSEFIAGQSYNLTVMIHNPSQRAYQDLEISSLSEFETSSNDSLRLSLLAKETKMAYSTLLFAPFVSEDTELSHATLIEDHSQGSVRIYLNESKILVHPILDALESDSPQEAASEPAPVVLGEVSAEFPVEQTAFSASLFWSILGILVLAIGLVAMLLLRHAPNTPPLVEVQRAIQEAQQLPTEQDEVDALLSKTQEMVKK